jgi:hypothetical protein
MRGSSSSYYPAPRRPICQGRLCRRQSARPPRWCTRVSLWGTTKEKAASTPPARDRATCARTGRGEGGGRDSCGTGLAGWNGGSPRGLLRRPTRFGGPGAPATPRSRKLCTATPRCWPPSPGPWQRTSRVSSRRRAVRWRKSQGSTTACGHYESGPVLPVANPSDSLAASSKAADEDAAGEPRGVGEKAE